MALLQLSDPVEVDTPLGRGYAIILESDSHDYYWTVEFSSCALVTFPQAKIKVVRSYARGGVSDDKMREIVKPNALIKAVTNG